jgi:trehalose 6-phosphate synthase
MPLSKRWMLFRSLRLPLRFIIRLPLPWRLAYSVDPLWIVSTCGGPWDIDILWILASTLQEPLTDLLEHGNRSKINALFSRVLRDERLFAIGYCTAGGSMPYRTQTFPKELDCTTPGLSADKPGIMLNLPNGLVHVAARSMAAEGLPAGTLILVHDMRFFERRSTDTRKYIILLFVVLGIVIFSHHGLCGPPELARMDGGCQGDAARRGDPAPLLAVQKP